MVVRLFVNKYWGGVSKLLSSPSTHTGYSLSSVSDAFSHRSSAQPSLYTAIYILQLLQLTHTLILFSLLLLWNIPLFCISISCLTQRQADCCSALLVIWIRNTLTELINRRVLQMRSWFWKLIVLYDNRRKDPCWTQNIPREFPFTINSDKNYPSNVCRLLFLLMYELFVLLFIDFYCAMHVLCFC